MSTLFLVPQVVDVKDPHQLTTFCHAVQTILNGTINNGQLTRTGQDTYVLGGGGGPPLDVPSGGTGDSTLTAHAVLVGEGTSPVGFAGPGALGTVLVGQGNKSDPAFSEFLSLGNTSADGTLSIRTKAGDFVNIFDGGSGFGNYNFVLPTTAGTGGQLLTSAGGGTSPMTWTTNTLTVGTTTITSGTSGRVLYDNAGVLGEMTNTGSGTVNVLQNGPTLTTPNIGAAVGTTLVLGGVALGGTLDVYRNASGVTLQVYNASLGNFETLINVTQGNSTANGIGSSVSLNNSTMGYATVVTQNGNGGLQTQMVTTGTGDVFHVAGISGGTYWYWGVDQSASATYCWSTGGGPGLSDAMRLTVGSKLTTLAGGSTSYVAHGGCLFDHYADAGNSTTTETDLYSDTTPASVFGTNGDKLVGEAGGVFVSSATATRQIKLYFAGTAIFDTGALTLSLSSAWCLYYTIIRVSATVVRYKVEMTTEGAALAAYTAVGELTGLTLSNTNILKTTGQAAGVGAATNDIVAKMGTTSWASAA